MANVLTEIDLCEACGQKLWPHLTLPAMHEGVLLVAVARVLDDCNQCWHYSAQLRDAAAWASRDLRSPAAEQPTHWAWVTRA